MSAEQDLEQVADRYRAEGYEVTVRPHTAQLPAFAADFHIDLMARNGIGGVLAQVMETRDDVARDHDLKRLAEVTNAQKGWRFDLVVLKSESPVEKIIREAEEPTLEEIGRWLEEAEQVSRMGAMRAAFVTAWSAFEAVMRRVARDSGIGGKRGATPHVLLNELYANGLLTPDQFRRMEEATRLRIEFVHGFVTPQRDGQLLQDIISVAKGLLTESPSGQPVGT